MGNNIALLCTTNYNKMFVDTRDLLIAPWLLMHGEWEPEETELVKKLIKPGDIFVDVGANLGYYSLLAARVGASHVYAFEAQPSTYELLGKNVIINWMTKFITYEHLAVYSHTTDLEFFVRNHYPGNSSLGFTAPDQLEKWFDTTTAVKIHAVSIDDYFADKPGKIDLIKVDVEGAEPAVFEGARRTLAKNRDIKILCEWSPDQMATARQDPAWSRRILGRARVPCARAPYGAQRSSAALFAHSRLSKSFALSVGGQRGSKFVASLGKTRNQFGIRALGAARQRLLVELKRAVDQRFPRVELLIPLSSRFPELNAHLSILAAECRWQMRATERHRARQAIPLAPSSITSFMPPARQPTTGFANIIASRNTRPNDS